ncbi:AAA family ATPase [Haladaptatus sp. DFWS20]|uniref:AAA family ATPase n=1 Tax=Haladaptatus sp. DFWS20 TaxID=3403467 RepID=UPI003EB8888C
MKPYEDTFEHLRHELKRLDLLLTLYQREWSTTAEGDGGQLRSLYISDETVRELLASPTGDRRSETQRAEEIRPLRRQIETTAGEIRTRERQLTDQKRRASDREWANDGGERLRFRHLADAFDLDRLHRDTLLLALAPELDPKYEKIYAYLQDDITKTRPTVDFVQRVLTYPERDGRPHTILTRRSPLIRNRLVRLSVDTETPRPSRHVMVDGRITTHLLGDDEVADELAALVKMETPPERRPDDSEQELHRNHAEAIWETHENSGQSSPLMTCFSGPTGAGKKATALELCAETDATLLGVDVEALVQQDVPETIRLLEREARLTGSLLYFDGWSELTGTPNTEVDPESFLRQIDSIDGDVFLAGREPLPAHFYLHLESHELHSINFPVPSYEERKELWACVDGLPDDVDVADIAGKFRFTSGQIADAVSTARHLSEDEILSTNAIYEGCRAQSSNTLNSLARQIEPNYTWEDIVLPADKMDHLREVAAHITQQGKVYMDWGFEDKFSLGNGLNVLFSGASGTGKTMAAEIIAGDAALDLYKIDLSSVVSKYIGETEKNLGKVFDEAEDTSAILLFDEADALFGKRTEVKDSHDRYANIEVNYLLQRIEEHDGTIILTTNFKQNIDDAFSRRLHCCVDFPRPDEEARSAIWRRIFPDATPVEELDVEFLVSLELTGGNIKNIALTAAFMAAEDDEAVGMQQVIRAVRREYQKAGKLIRPEEFGRYRHLLT